MPCYLEENVRAQRGRGVYEKSVGAILRLNALGYGSDPGLPLDLVYNPGGPFLPPDQAGLQAAALSLLEQTLAEFVASREREGAKLAAVMHERLDGIERIAAHEAAPALVAV